MSGYGSHKLTCGECGDSYEASGVCGDLQVARWMREHKEQHRVEKMSVEEQNAYWENRVRSSTTFAYQMKAMTRAQGKGDSV